MLLGPEVTSALLAGTQAPATCPVHVTEGASAWHHPTQMERSYA